MLSGAHLKLPHSSSWNEFLISIRMTAPTHFIFYAAILFGRRASSRLQKSPPSDCPEHHSKAFARLKHLFLVLGGNERRKNFFIFLFFESFKLPSDFFPCSVSECGSLAWMEEKVEWGVGGWVLLFTTQKQGLVLWWSPRMSFKKIWIY